MQVSEFLVVANLYSIVFHRSVVGQNSEVISGDPVQRDRQVTVNFGDLAIHVTPPLGREYIVNTQPFHQQWQNVDDVPYCESIYDSPDHILQIEDLLAIPCESVQPEITPEGQIPEDKCELSAQELDFSDDPGTLIPMTKNPYPDRCERVNPLRPVEKVCRRRKREIVDSKEEKVNLEEVTKDDRKKRTLSLRQRGLGRSRCRSNFPSDYMYQYGRRFYRPHSYKQDYYIDDYPDEYDNTGATRSEEFVDSATSDVECVNSVRAKASQVVSGTIASAARQLAQAKHDVIDLGNQATQAIESRSLNNAATDGGEGRVGQAVATNIDGGLEGIGNSVLDTNSGIINADRDISLEIPAPLAVNKQAEVGIVEGSDEEEAVGIISNAEFTPNSESANVDVHEEIVAAKKDGDTDLKETEVVGEIQANDIVKDTTQIDTPLESLPETHADTEEKPEKGTETETVGSRLQVNAKSEGHSSLDATISSRTTTDVNVGKTHDYRQAQGVTGSQHLPCEFATSPAGVRDRGFYLRPRYYEEGEKQRGCEGILPGERESSRRTYSDRRGKPKSVANVDYVVRNYNRGISERFRDVYSAEDDSNFYSNEYRNDDRRFWMYDDYDDGRGYERFLVRPYRNHRSENSRTRDISGAHNFKDEKKDINAESANVVQAKSSLHLDSHLDIGGTRLPITNSADLRDAINSAVHGGVGIHTSPDAKLGGHLGRGIQSSLNSDSYLDTRVSRASGDSGIDRRSKIKEDRNRPDGKVVKKIFADVYQESPDIRKQSCRPNSRFKHTDPVRHSHDCENCRRLFYTRTNRFCPHCEKQKDAFGERQTYLSGRTIHHLDEPKQNFKRTTDPSKSIELYPAHTCGYNRSINLNANCSDETLQRIPDIKGLKDNLQNA